MTMKNVYDVTWASKTSVFVRFETRAVTAVTEDVFVSGIRVDPLNTIYSVPE
jgi:hypothetical protein